MRRIALGLCTIAGVLALAAPANAGSLSRRTGAVIPAPVLSYAAAAGEINVLSFAVGSEKWILRDIAPVTATAPCGTGDGYTTFDPYCPSSGLGGTEISLGDQDDRADLSAVPAPVIIVLGAGRDTVTTGAKDDVVDARDGEVDTITCGAGKDTVLRDPADAVAADCEGSTPGAGGVVGTTGSGGTTKPPGATTPKPKVTLTVPAQRLRKVRRRGLLLLARAGETPVDARIVITLPRAVAKRLKLGARKVRAATRVVELGSFETRRIHVKLSKRVARSLARAGKRTPFQLAATPTAADGRRGAVAKRTVRVRR